MSNTIYPNFPALIEPYGAEIFGQALDHNYAPMFDIFPEGKVLTCTHFLDNTMERTDTTIPITAKWLVSNPSFPRYLNVIDHATEQARYYEFSLSGPDHLSCKRCLGPTGLPAVDYTNYLAKGAFIIDLFIRKVGTSTFMYQGRCTARSGKAASMLVNEAKRNSVTVDETMYGRLGASKTYGRDFRFGKIVLRLCGGTTTWLRKENSNIWTCKGALAPGE